MSRDHASADLSRCHIHRAEFDGAQFRDTTSFGGAQFGGDAEFKYAQFSGDAGFDYTQFSGPAVFHDAQFAHGADFVNARARMDVQRSWPDGWVDQPKQEPGASVSAISSVLAAGCPDTRYVGSDVSRRTGDPPVSRCGSGS